MNYTALPNDPTLHAKIAERLERYIDRQPDGCWLWTGYTTRGYGSTEISYRPKKAHRLTYELAKGPIPHGLHLDHLCRVTRCVNPDHLEPVTPKVNAQRGEGGQYMKARMAAKTHCARGHLYTPENVYTVPSTGHRQCRICCREATRRWKVNRSQLQREWADPAAVVDHFNTAVESLSTISIGRGVGDV